MTAPARANTGFTSTFEPFRTTTEKTIDPPGPDLDGAIDIAAQYLGMTRAELLDALAPVVAEHKITTTADALGIDRDKAGELLLRLSPTPSTLEADLLRIKLDGAEFRIQLADERAEHERRMYESLFTQVFGPRPPATPRRSLLDRLRGRAP